MRMAGAVSMVVIGAILAFAVTVNVPYISLRMVGLILMAGGLFLMLWIVIRSSRRNVAETKTSYDPATYSETTRYEQSNGL